MRILAFAAVLGSVPSYLTGWAEASIRTEREPVQQSSGLAGYEATSYLYAPSNDRKTTYQSLSLEAGTQVSGSLLEFGANGNLLLNVRPSLHPYFEIPNLYAGTAQDALPLQLRIGRKLEPWSQLDETWQLGILQPRFRWDYLHPQSVGLLGGFLELNQPGLRIVGFASPVYIPERGVPIRVDNGHFSSPSAWFIPPSNRISLFEKDTPVHYNLEIPPMQDIILQPSAGFLARVGGPEGFWGSGSYAQKPMNQLLLAHDAHLRLDELALPVKIAPRVAYHHVTSLETGYTAKRFGLSLSFLHEEPIDQTLTSNWTAQSAAPATALSPSMKFEVGNSRSGPSLISLGYLWRWGGNAPDHGRDASRQSVFEARYPFERAVRLAVKSPGVFGLTSPDFTGSSRVIYDSSEDGAIWSTEMHYQTRENWRMTLGADFLATHVLSNTETFESGNFIKRYQVHNRVQAGVSYVF